MSNKDEVVKDSIKIDITMTATVRPKLLTKTLEFFCKNLFVDRDRYRLIINVDPIGEYYCKPEDMVDVANSFFNNVKYNIAEKPSFSEAFKWCWNQVERDYVFHLEDDWKLNVPLDIDKMIKILEKYPSIACLRLYPHKIKMTDREDLYLFDCKYIIKENFLFTENQDDQFGLNPSLIKGEFVKEARKYLLDGLNPEKQFRSINKKLFKNVVKKWNYALYAKPGDSYVIKDMGRIWMDTFGYEKDGKGEGFQSWKKSEDTRPDQYHYWTQLIDHLKDDTKFFNDELIYPRQFEIHLPGNHKKPCDLHCPHCAGKLFQKDLGNWEVTGLELLNNLAGKIPFHIYGGAYTEPLINPYYMAFLATTKRYGNHFGIHTNGVLLNQLENSQGWLTELNRISTDDIDYLSVSLDAGLPWCWGATKGTKQYDLFNQIIMGLREAVRIRKKNGKGHAIRLCYLISPESGTAENFGAIVNIARDIGVDSLRFSIPFGCYNQSFDKIREYKQDREIPDNLLYNRLLLSYLSKDKTDRPYIFYTGPEYTDIERFDFKHCLYGYYQITYGADGYVYKCSTTATPTMKVCRVGKITSDVNKFEKMIKKNQNSEWNCESCFKRGARCNRMGLEINSMWKDNYEENWKLR